jgi:hypothetical protein
MTYRVILPDDFDEYAWEVEKKGWFNSAYVEFDGLKIHLLVYDPTRLSQDMEESLSSTRLFFERNVLVVPMVNRDSIEASVKILYESGELKRWKESCEAGVAGLGK